MQFATKAEAQRNYDAAKQKADIAFSVMQTERAQINAMSVNSVGFDAASLHYDRCIREFEEAINELGNWDNGEATD